ncbi:MAG: 6-phosphogluconolactonase [Alphaproteobacteria bacterium]|nr:6-phosphogluconolactonase [Alphaproteobacteria bacterium]
MNEAGPVFHAFPSFDRHAATLADRTVEIVNAAAAARADASLAVPGGSTPGALFDVLSRRRAHWDMAAITLTDERWVPPESERSNEHLVRTRLIVEQCSSARLVPLKTPAPDPAAGEAEAGARVAAMARPFDLVIAGMGDDGHTASWIPGSAGLGRALDMDSPKLVQALIPPAANGLDPRLSLTLRAVLDARRIVILIRGSAKRVTYERALAERDEKAMPVRALIFNRTVPVEIFWSD